MTQPAQPVTFAGPPVRTGVAFTPPGHVRLSIDGSNAPIDLDGNLVATLFALGLETSEPDPSGRVVLGELDVDDRVSFLVGSTAIDRPAGMRAMCRGIERALDEGVARRRDTRHSATDRNEEP